ncbi:hypothetical protein BDF19DRAFT_433096 [Syncephalis fuscata]|nr:hypothetical protein BDF19DRAFT_433096 [Syncephalis fuscata]
MAKQLLSPAEYRRWRQRKVESDPKCIMFCPNKRCSHTIWTVIDGNPQPSPAKCPECKLILCLRCKTEHHKGMSICHTKQLF